MSALNLPELLGVNQLNDYLEKTARAIEDCVANAEPSLAKPINRILRSGGKKLRPSLLIATANAVNTTDTPLLVRAAASVELVHLASLIHDDIIDQSVSRRGVKTINGHEGVGQAIVAGDFLLAQANYLASSVSSEVGQALAIAIARLCEGQSRELADVKDLSRSISSMNLAIAGKTASLFAAACQIGCMVGGANPSDTAKFYKFGENFGMAFQLIDDVLDFLSAPKKLGKPLGTDVSEGVYSLPVLASPQALKLLSGKRQPTLPQLISVMFKDGSLQMALDNAYSHCKTAADAVKTIDKKLQIFPERYIQFVLNNLLDDNYRERLPI